MEIDLLDGEFYAGDPWPTYARMREEAPVYRDEANEIWGVSRHADVIAIEKDPRRFCSRHGFRPKMTGGDVSMIGRDDPQHLTQPRCCTAASCRGAWRGTRRACARPQRD